MSSIEETLLKTLFETMNEISERDAFNLMPCGYYDYHHKLC